MRSKLGIAACAFLLASVVRAQSPDDGAVRDGVYRNAFFHIAFALPGSLRAVDLSSLKLPAPPTNGREFALMAAREPSAPYGMVLIAETLGSGYGYFRDEKDFLDRVRLSEHIALSTKTLVVPGSVGSSFQELHYTSGGEPTAAVVLKLNGHLLVWRCNAGSEADLAAMLAAIRGLHKTP